MSLELSTIGITLGYCAEATAGTKPTTGYTTIQGIKSIPDLNQEPDQIECTDLSDTTYKRYVKGLKDTGGTLGFGANFTKAFATTWNTLVSLYATSATAGKAIWFKVGVPQFGDFYFAGEPVALGLPSSEVNALFEGQAYIICNKVEGWTLAS